MCFVAKSTMLTCEWRKPQIIKVAQKLCLKRSRCGNSLLRRTPCPHHKISVPRGPVPENL